MPDNIKMSLQNALTIVGAIIAFGIAYSSMAGRAEIGEKNDVKQDERIEKLEYGAHEASKERVEAKTRDEYTVAALSRIEDWIKGIDEIKENNNGKY